MNIILLDDKLLPLFSECLPKKMLTQISASKSLVFGAVRSETRLPAGVLIASVFGRNVYIDWIYTLPEFRNTGVASLLLSELALALADNSQLDNIVVALPQGSEYETLPDFFQSLGFELSEEYGKEYCFTPADLAQSELWKSTGSHESVVALKNVSNIMLTELSQTLSKNETCAVPIPLRRESYDAELSAFVVVKNKITAALLIRHTNFGYELAFLYTERSAYLKQLLRSAGTQAICSLAPDTLICTSAIDSAAEVLLTGLIPGIKPVKERYAAVRVIHEERV